jgi:hypothetical protein
MEKRNPNYLGSALLAATTLVVAACSSGGRDTPEPTPPPANTAPTVMAITDRTADQDTPVTLDFGVSDTQTTDAAMLVVTATADAATLFPADDGVVLGGSGATRTLTLTPLEAQTGTATITVTAADPQGLVATRTFKVTVNAKSASALATWQSLAQKGEKDSALQINGFTYQQDLGDAITAMLPPVEPLAGIDP